MSKSSQASRAYDGVHESAIVSSKARLGRNVLVGPYSIIHDAVEIEDDATIGAYCEIGVATPLAEANELLIGVGAVIRSHTVLYCGSRIRAGLTTGHYGVIRENSIIGKGFQLGNRSDVQGDCEVGNYVRTHADVHIGKRSRIGNCVWLFPDVLLTNDPTPPSETMIGPEIGDYTVIASKVLLMPGVKVGRDCVIAASSVVTTDVADGKVARGNPAREVCDAAILRMQDHPGRKAYPWRRRFHRGYPPSLVQSWLRELSAE